MEEGRSAFNLQEGLGVDGRALLEWILNKQVPTRNWDDSAQDMDYWRALVNVGSITPGVSFHLSYFLSIILSSQFRVVELPLTFVKTNTPPSVNELSDPAGINTVKCHYYEPTCKTCYSRVTVCSTSTHTVHPSGKSNLERPTNVDKNNLPNTNPKNLIKNLNPYNNVYSLFYIIKGVQYFKYYF